MCIIIMSECPTFAPATFAPAVNPNVKRNPNPNPNPNLNPYPTPNYKPNHHHHSNSLLSMSEILSQEHYYPWSKMSDHLISNRRNYIQLNKEQSI